MAGPYYEAKLIEISLAEINVKDKIEEFSPEQLQDHDLEVKQDKLKEIVNLLDKFKHLINAILVKPPEGVNNEEIARIKNVKTALQTTVINHAATVRAKARELQ